MPISFVLFHRLILNSFLSVYLSFPSLFPFSFPLLLFPFLCFTFLFFNLISLHFPFLYSFPGFIWFFILSLLYPDFSSLSFPLFPFPVLFDFFILSLISFPYFFSLAPFPNFSFSFLKPLFFIFLRPSPLRNSDYSLMNRIWSSLLSNLWGWDCGASDEDQTDS